MSFVTAKELVIPARYLVPGDIIKLRAGDYLTCDCRIISEGSITVYEADVTGVVIAEKHNCTLPLIQSRRDARI